MNSALGIGFVVFMAFWTPLIPLFGGGIRLFPSLGDGLGSVAVGWIVVLVIATIAVIGLKNRATLYGKGFVVLGSLMWLLWGIACIPNA